MLLEHEWNALYAVNHDLLIQLSSSSSLDGVMQVDSDLIEIYPR
jgi:hypothetical protein